MNKIGFWLISCVVLLGTTTACREEFNDHYNDVIDASINKTIAQVLEEKGGFDLFLQLIDKAELRATLANSGIYTCFAPRDADVQSYLDKNGYTVETMPKDLAITYVNYHFVAGMWYQYYLERKYVGFDDTDDYYIAYPAQVTYNTRGDLAHPAKKIRLYTAPYLNARGEDYSLLRGEATTDFMVEGTPVSEEDRDIPASNGVIHVLDGPLELAPNAAEALEKDPEFSMMYSFFERFAGMDAQLDDKGNIVRTYKYYNVSVPSASTRILDITDESLGFVMIMPDDNAVKNMLQPFMVPEYLGNSYDDIPDRLVVAILTSLVANNIIAWGVSDFDRNDPYFMSWNTTFLPIANNLRSLYKESVLSSNAIIYKVKEMPALPVMQSPEAGVYMMDKRYQEWGKMMDRGKVNVNGGTSGVYQNPPRTLLMQPDEAPIWEVKKVEDYETTYLDTLGYRMSSGFLYENVQDGNFEHGFYRGLYGYILYDDVEGVFKDWKGNEVRLLRPDPVWDASKGATNGAIYEVDGIFEALMQSDSTVLMYRHIIEKEADFTYFKDLCDRSGFTKELNTPNGLIYTVFAPTNDALVASYGEPALAVMTKEQATEIVHNHAIPNTRIFTDGKVSGSFDNVLREALTINGAWDTFRVMRPPYSTAEINPAYANRQASNGVFHGINTVLQN